MAFMLPLNGISKSFAIGRTCQFLPYFTWGILVQHYGLDLVRTQKIKKFSVLIVIVVLLSISFMHPRLLHIVTFHREDIQAICTQTGASICMVWFYKLYVEIAALMFCLFMLSFSNLFQVIGEYGKSTMTLFVLQALTIHFLVRRLPHNIYVELCVAAVVIFAGMCLSMKGYGSYIINPFSTLFKLKNKQV